MVYKTLIIMQLPIEIITQLGFELGQVVKN